jgi:hypothetical protein
MAGHGYGSLMKVASTDSSSMASRKREARECPYCNVPLVQIQSKQPATKDEWFLVCLKDRMATREGGVKRSR